MPHAQPIRRPAHGRAGHDYRGHRAQTRHECGGDDRAQDGIRFYIMTFDVANSVKWAIESASKIPCFFRDVELLTEATPATANRLTEIADPIACSCLSKKSE